MYNVTRTFRIPIGHRLSCHQGLCKNIHGHNLKLQVSLKSETLNDNYMVLDFAELKQIVNQIIEKWDHCLILNESDVEYVEDMSEKMMKLLVIKGEPTAENLCIYLFKQLSDELESRYPAIEVNFVRIWENDDAYAEYNGEV